MTNLNQFKIIKTEEEWRNQLTPKQFEITRKHGTEQAFSSPNFDTSKAGIFSCICCGKPLFRSETKYESGTGWPSFYQPINADAVISQEDHSHGMVRMEVLCADCGSHLGHVFSDGPKPTGLRYCMNGFALTYQPDKTDK